MAIKFVLSTTDYIVVAIILTISASIGVYFRLSGGRQKTNAEFLLAGRDMPILPVAFSLMATFMSATTLMGIPAEMYLFGTHMTFMNIGFVLGPVLAAWLFLPIYFDTGVSTTYEYLENRFGKSIRRILSAGFLLQVVLFSAVTLYAPALALSAVTNIPLWLAIVSVGVVCTFYCTFGGIKAVMWTDVFQAILMFVCILVIIIQGCKDVGGLSNVFKIAKSGGRLVVPSLTIDTSERYTMLSVFLQGVIITLANYGCSQDQVQRLLTVKNTKHSVIAAVASIPMVTCFQLSCCLCGLIFYAVFHSCDPLSSVEKPIESADQGAILGILAGTSLGAYLSVITSQIEHEILPLSNECRLQNQTHGFETNSFFQKASTTEFSFNSTLTSFNSSDSQEITSIRSLSYMWITPISFFMSLSIGYIFSLIFILIQGEPQNVPEIHLSPIRRRFCKDKKKIAQQQKSNQQRNELEEINAKTAHF